MGEGDMLKGSTHVSVSPSSTTTPDSFMRPKWTDSSDILKIVEDNAEIQVISDSRYKSIDVSKTMTDLIMCTDLLQVALNAAGNAPCAKDIVAVCGGYQDLCADSTVATVTFVETCLQALKFHNMTLKAMQAKKYKLALKAFEKVGPLATQMAAISDQLVDDTDKLMKIAQNALLSSVTDRTTRAKLLKEQEEESKKMEAHIKKLQVELDEESKKMEAHTKKLQVELDELPAQINEANKAAKQNWEGARSTATKTAMVKAAVLGAMTITLPPAALVAGIASVLTSDGADKEREAALKAEQQARALMEEQRKKKADMAEAVALLQKSVAQGNELDKAVKSLEKSVAQGNELDKAVKSLEVCNKALGKIKTRFVQMKMFWGHVAAHCRSLSTLKDQLETGVEFAEDGMMDEFDLAFVESGKGWAALGLVSIQANNALVTSSARINDVMNDLPTGREGKEKIQGMIEALKQTLEDGEDQELEEAEKMMKAHK